MLYDQSSVLVPISHKRLEDIAGPHAGATECFPWPGAGPICFQKNMPSANKVHYLRCFMAETI